MAEPELVQQQNAVLRDLVGMVERRKAAGEEAEARYQQRLSEARLAHEAAGNRAHDEFGKKRAVLDREFAEVREAVNGRLRLEYESCEREYHTSTRDVNDAYSGEMRSAKHNHEQARWEGNTVYDAKKHVPRREFKEREKQIKLKSERIAELETAFFERLIELRRPLPSRVVDDERPIEEMDPGEPLEEPAKQWQEHAQTAEALLGKLRTKFVPSLFRGIAPLWVAAFPAALVAVPVGFAVEWKDPLPIGIAAGCGLLAGIGLCIWLWKLGKKQVVQLHAGFLKTMIAVEELRRRWLCQELNRTRKMQAEIKKRHDDDLAQADFDFKTREQVSVETRDRKRAALEQKYVPQLAQMRELHEGHVRNAQVNFPQRAADLETAREKALVAADDDLQQAKNDAQELLDQDWQRISALWHTGVERIRSETEEIGRVCRGLFPTWNDKSWDKWEPGEGIAPVLQFGKFDVTLDRLPGGELPVDRLGNRNPPRYTLPAMLSFPERCSMLIKTSGSGRAEAVQTLQTVMMRFLTSLPAGKVRFTIIDPVGLGQNFAGFMHLADFDEKLVGSRIWTEPQFIEQRLADLTSHMANVIQKYLRNEFDTIEDYNRHAGEVAEPYRILVVANFPFNFTDNAARHLMSIISSGARCGVYTLMSVDMKQRLPHGFNLSDLEQNAVKLVWKDQRFVCKDGDWEHLPLLLDAPPSQDRFTQLLQRVGERAKAGSRVEVPFEFIAPRDNDWWSKQSGSEIDVPLGRAGATKRQHLQLGHGTSQHVLIAGKTGSGKSTMMHALITNVALYYSPLEVELYLIDFKKGVEFKTYATHDLPHARVVAIESEREFGLSVLQRLDVELKLRGDLFRDLNVQDVKSYREATGKHLPRMLLIIDEFQEFFIEDDKIAQETSLLLDRLVRQGRAFGVHVHLGTQTLGGAYSLARTTLGQMAIRIALQCSEADSHLILSEDNPAARLLTRPGEAIYNDANGRVEGNHLFQVVWLTDDKREDYLKRIRALAEQRNVLPATPQIVFEGNVPANIEKNHLLTAALDAPRWAEQLTAAHAWLGEAIAIKDPTMITFRRQGGSNALILGQQGEAALAMEVVALTSLAAQHSADTQRGASFYVLDGSPPDAMHAGYWQRASATFPHRCQVGGLRDTGRLVGEISQELTKRQADGAVGVGEIYLVVHDLQRFRDLRKAEDDFGFGRGEEKPNPGKQLANILREGPSLGIHTIIWCDSLNNFQRTFDRAAMREFEVRILFQMSQADSANLIDSPAAGRLGPNRALLYSEEQGRLEKFRPYNVPDDEWLKTTGARLLAKRDEAPAGAAPADAATT
ncbi:MAG: cell division protein FtsK [Planctomycetia bacterium]|nr:cell division protein FtsK [Planctomycetia bacterium]